MSSSDKLFGNQEQSKSDLPASKLFASLPGAAYRRSARRYFPVPTDATFIDDRYEVAGRPFVGGMGIVYLCFGREDQRPVALKTFRPEYIPGRAAHDRWL